MQLADEIAAIGATATTLAIFGQLYSVQRQLFIQNFSEQNRRYNDILRRMPRELLFDTFEIGKSSGKLRQDCVAILWEYFDLSYEQWFLSQNRYATRTLRKMWQSGLASSMARPAFRDGWILVKVETTYPQAFQKYIDDLAGLESQSCRMG